MAKVLGWDIGGANTKAAFLVTKKGFVQELKTGTEFFPIWIRGKEHLPSVLRGLREKLAGSVSLDAVGVTMTAELSDIYETKREGVNHILSCVGQEFLNCPIFVGDVEGNLKTFKEAREKPLTVAAANWPATGWMVAQLIRNCVIIDAGSTTTSIIPVLEGKQVASGRNDFEKLVNGELVYTGALRTNVATIVSRIPVGDVTAQVSSELFALSADVHLILGNISEKEYTTETADNRGKSRKEAMARLARVVCADEEILSESQIIRIANYVCEKQVEQIVEGLKLVCDRVGRHTEGEMSIAVAGLGRRFLGKKAAEKAGFSSIIDLGDLLGSEAALATPSVAIALMVATKLEGRLIKWKRLSKSAAA